MALVKPMTYWRVMDQILASFSIAVCAIVIWANAMHRSEEVDTALVVLLAFLPLMPLVAWFERQGEIIVQDTGVTDASLDVIAKSMGYNSRPHGRAAFILSPRMFSPFFQDYRIVHITKVDDTVRLIGPLRIVMKLSTAVAELEAGDRK